MIKILLVLFFALPVTLAFASEYRIEAPDCVRDYEYMFTVSPKESKTEMEWVVPVYRKEVYDKLERSTHEITPVKTVAPRYPVMAAQDGIEGHVCYIFDLDAEGKISNLRVYDSQPKRVFDKESTAAFVRWQFDEQKDSAITTHRKNVRYCLDFKLE